MSVDLQSSALALRDRLADGSLRATELAKACIAQVEAREPEVQAWAWFDSDHVLKQAEALDAYRGTGRPIGPLHGLPVALKDIIDTAGIPTESGTVLDAGRVPAKDAFVVARLRQAGAIVLGKTVTTELAYFAPGKTRNPHNPKHTPGGSSSGSAAAVASGMAPLAIGTQTAGSVIRPAAFCGIVGYKPTFGAIPRTGAIAQSPTLDTLGVFARTVEDAAMLAEPLFGYDAGDPASAMIPVPRLVDTAITDPPVRPTLAFSREPGWETAEPDTRSAFADLLEVLGDDCDEIELPAPFAEAVRLRDLVNKVEMAKSYHHYEARGRDKLSDVLRAALDEGKRVLARDYLSACDWPRILSEGLEIIFARYDAIITPAAPGPAPEGLGATGNPIFNAVWTFCGAPAVNLPVFEASNGMPMGLQLVGRRGDDARLLRTARWLAIRLSQSD